MEDIENRKILDFLSENRELCYTIDELIQFTGIKNIDNNVGRIGGIRDDKSCCS